MHRGRTQKAGTSTVIVEGVRVHHHVVVAQIAHERADTLRPHVGQVHRRAAVAGMGHCGTAHLLRKNHRIATMTKTTNANQSSLTTLFPTSSTKRIAASKKIMAVACPWVIQHAPVRRGRADEVIGGPR